MKAIVVNDRSARIQPDRPKPALRDDYVLVKTVAVALNPTDWKHAAFGLASSGGLLGCDFAGVVEQVGVAVTKPLRKGDRVCGVAHGGNVRQPEDGAFAEYIVAKGDLQIKIPDQMSFATAATVPLGAFTVGQGLFQKALKLNLPTHPVTEKTYVLIYGGSTATGALAVQYAKLAGYTVVTTCSPKNFDYVKSLGADAAFGYNEAAVGTKIRQYTDGSLKLAWDTISEHSSPQICADALSAGPGCRYGCILPVKFPRDDVETVHTLMYTIFAEDFEKAKTKFPVMPADFEFAKQFTAITETLLAEGKLKPHRGKVGPDGLKGVLQGLQDLQNNNVSGEKLVYLIDQTP